MAEVLNNVYDILFPSPPALKDIVAISIAVQLWRREINTHRIKNTLGQLNLKQNILSSSSITRIPATTLSLIEKYLKRVGLSISQWLADHCISELFEMRTLNDFIDFVGDFDGSIHYVRTAKRLVQCDQVDPIIRFHFACSYCFEDDVLRIWPSVSSDNGVKLTSGLYFAKSISYYWICRLRNQLYKLPRPFSFGHSIEEEIFHKTLTRCIYEYVSWPLIEYFWNRLDSDARIRIITNPDLRFHKACRYLLSKFNGIELNKFVNVKGCQIIFDLLCDSSKRYVQTCDRSYMRRSVEYRLPYIMAFWTFIKDEMNENCFFLFVQKIIQELYGSPHPICIPIYCKFWNTAPDHLKAHVIRELFLGDLLFQRDENTKVTYIDGSFLLTALSDASAEDRRSFWNKHWGSLIDLMCTNQLDKLMSLCFRNDENEIVEFKLNSLSVLENIRGKCSRLLNNLSVEELNHFLSFCCPDDQTRRNIRLSLLVEEFKLDVQNFRKISPLLNDFINDAYDDVSLAADFKTQFLFSPSTVEKFTELIDSYSCGVMFQHEVQFIDILAPSEQAARELKRFYALLLLKQKLTAGNFKSGIEENELSNFIQECTCSDDQIAEFKKTLFVDEIVQYVIRNALTCKDGPKCNSFLVQFLEWYFNTPQALEEFKKRYSDDDVFIQLTTKSE